VVVDMAKSSIDIAVEHARLCEMTIFELRGAWRRLHRAPPPMRLSRDLLMRGIIYKLQERPLGGLSKSILRKLERLNLDSETSDAQKPAPPISLKAGTRLVREWRGVTHTVLVHTDGVEWNGRRYRSLTIVAREITGAHWSGPRFFGLRTHAGRSVESAEVEHAEA
jgi:Protein of unknown function (DUF2924)